MSSNSIARPKAVSVAILCALSAWVFNIIAIVVWREAYGEGWVLVLFTRFIATVIYGVFFSFAYHGKNWVRYAYLVLVAVGVGRYLITDARFLLDPQVMVPVILSAVALVFWFLPITNRWYQQQREIRIRNRNTGTQSK